MGVMRSCIDWCRRNTRDNHLAQFSRTAFSASLLSKTTPPKEAIHQGVWGNSRDPC